MCDSCVTCILRNLATACFELFWWLAGDRSLEEHLLTHAVLARNLALLQEVMSSANSLLLPHPATAAAAAAAGSVKTLHLYEARYLAMLEEVLSNPGRNKFIGHVVIEQLGDPVGSRASAFPHSFVGENFVMLMGTLCRVSRVAVVFFASFCIGSFLFYQLAWCI
jgi:hypothetical protein